MTPEALENKRRALQQQQARLDAAKQAFASADRKARTAQLITLGLIFGKIYWQCDENARLWLDERMMLGQDPRSAAKARAGLARLRNEQVAAAQAAKKRTRGLATTADV